MRVSVAALALVLSLAACAGDEQGADPTVTASPAGTTQRTSTPTSTIVGSWERVTTCEQRVKALQTAGLEEFAAEHAAGEGWLPGVTDPAQIEDPANPCEGAIPLKHGHFFTEDGRFGSTDDQGDEVDDGTYRVVNPDTIVVEKEFGNVSFHYRIEDGELFLEPVMPDCAKTGCFAAQWAVAVAYPGLPWQRSKS